MRRLFFTTLSSIMILMLCMGSVFGGTTWNSLRTRHFVVFYMGDGRATAVRAGDIAEKWESILARKLKFEPTGLTPINLYPDRMSFSQATGVPTNDSIVGMAHSRMASISIDASGLFADVERIIPHELVHIFVSYRLGSRAVEMPIWMHEGLAKYLASDWTGQDAELLADAATESRFFRLKDISVSFPDDPEQRSIAYVQSYAMVRYMAEKYTDACIPDLLTEMADGSTFAKAMRYSIAAEPDEFEAGWQKYVAEKYNVDRWTRFAFQIIFPTMAVLAVLAFRARRKAVARKASEFEEEEEAVSDSEADEFEDLS